MAGAGASRFTRCLPRFRRILQRPLAGYSDIVEHTAVFAAETGISKPVQRRLHEMLRLALAVRDADGDDLVDELDCSGSTDPLGSHGPNGQIVTMQGVWKRDTHPVRRSLCVDV